MILMKNMNHSNIVIEQNELKFDLNISNILVNGITELNLYLT